MITNHKLLKSLILFVTLLINPFLIAAESDQAFLPGLDYEVIAKSDESDVAQLSELESISNIEVFYWYGCSSCYQVEAAINDYILENSQLSLRRTPLIIRSSWRQQAYIQPLMAQLTELEQLPSTLEVYRQCLSDCSVFGEFESTLNWFSKQADPQIRPTINKEAIWQAEKSYQKRADLFSISQVPTIIINETYKVNANQAKTAKRLVEIINYLLSK